MQHFGYMNSIVCAEIAIGRPVVSDMPWLSRNVLQASFDVVTICHLSTCWHEWNMLLAAPSRAAKFTKRMEHNNSTKSGVSRLRDCTVIGLESESLRLKTSRLVTERDRYDIHAN